ncbi:MAG: thioredoxin domain-containing protein [Nocardioides sp.]|nr:thioredoxin domain-containing protein [Nocardioides sp.]
MSKKSKTQSRADRAAAMVREQQDRERRRNTLIVVAVVVAMVAIIGGGFLINAARDSSKDIDAAESGETEHGIAIGDPDAPRQVIIYEDFLCPYCGQLEVASSDGLDRLAEEGKVYVDYRPFQLLSFDYSRDSVNAFAVVLEAAGPEVAKEFHDLLFEEQPSEAGPFPDSDWFVDKAVEAGADADEVRAGIENGEKVGWVEDATEAAYAAGINSTPVVLLDGEIYQDGRTMEELAGNLVTELE